MIGRQTGLPAGNIYMVALTHTTTEWLEEFSKPWKGGK
jgi:hypothetical protein